MDRPQKKDFPEFYQRYIDLTTGNNIQNILSSVEKETLNVLLKVSEEKSSSAYAPGKWTIKELLLHLIDAETVFVFRALWLARGGKENLPGFDHDSWVTESNANDFTHYQLIEDYKSTRAFTLATFSKFTDKELSKKGLINGSTMSCNFMPYLIAGHNLHHLSIIKERYL